MRKFNSKMLSVLLSGALVFNALVVPLNVNGTTKNLSNQEQIVRNVKTGQKIILKNFNNNELKEKYLSNGENIATELNKLKNNKVEFKKRLKVILDSYYSLPKSQRSELKNFKKNIDVSAIEMVKNYEEAEKERENQDNLDFDTSTIVVSFPYNTTIDYINEIMEKEDVISYEIIDDGQSNIADDLEERKKNRLEAIKDWKSDIVVLVEVSLEYTIDKAKSNFEKYSNVKIATDNTLFEQDGTITTNYTATSNDPQFNETTQWNLKNVDIPRAWNRFKSIDTIICTSIAVIDSGVQMNHKELSGLLMKSKSVDVTQNNKKLVDCKDECSATGQYTEAHGTSVVGVIAARGNNSYQGAGVASIANGWCRNSFEIMAIKCDNSTADRHINEAYLSKAIDYAVDNGAEVINISYSAKKSEYSNFTVLENSIKRAIAAEVCVVCSAGNDGSTEVRYPAGFSGVIGVGATWKNGKLALYSNESSAVDIVAPGGYSTSNGARMYLASPTTINPNGYRYSHGTSYATPHVAGTIAMMLSIKNCLTPSQILSRLQNRSTSTVAGNINTSKKFKFLNAGKSVALMEEE